MRKIRLNERDLQSIVRRVVNESQLLNEETAPCNGGDNRKCGSCVGMGNAYTKAGGNGNDFINKVCFGEGKVKGGDCDIENGETMGARGCVCTNPKRGCGEKGEKGNQGRMNEGTYRRIARNKRR